VGGAVGVIGFGIAEDLIAHANKNYTRDGLWYTCYDYICAELSGVYDLVVALKTEGHSF
jgi:hypothetical protein